VLVLIEDRQPVREALAAKIGDYPYRAWTGVDYRSISLHSRFPITDWRVESTDFLAHIVTGHLLVPTDAGEREVFFIATHPLAPIEGERAHQRRKALARLAKRAAESEVPVILLGDLNLTPQSVYFARLLKAGNLRDTARGRVSAPTWMVPIPSIGLRIDHVLVSPDIAVAARRVGPDFRSDHRPVTVDLVVPGP
jgi:endonuclease/exonuclease/phosphatase family metal-dependent hydrolase